MTQPSNLKGALLGLLAMGLFAVSDIGVKFLGGGYHPFQIIFFAGVLSLPLVVLHIMADPAGGRLRPEQPRLMALRSFIVVLNGIAGTFAFASLPLAEAYAIFFTMPIFITVLSALALKEPIDLLRGVAVVAGLLGVIVALDPGQVSLRWGHAAALAAAILGAANYVIIRFSGGAERTIVLILYPMMAQLIVATLALPFVYRAMPFADLAVTGAMALAAFAGYFAIIAAYRRAPGIVVAPMQYSQIIWAAVFGALLFDEVMSLQTILGTAIIILAGLVIVARQQKAG
ncbi:DMT family transporter [Tabrizicola sp. BL-A-41-H6]|uniref:DMT family transporter n=1 Tax=Tabrizicola sp. BL-A-41-H6 TaxID=3421107 RepID=UPI003D663DFE